MTIASIVLSLLLIVVSIWFSDFLVQALLAMVPILASIYTVTQNYYEKNLSSTRTNISINTHENEVIIACSIKSSHPKRLFVDKAYLFIDYGEQEEELFKFEHLLRHKHGEQSCLIEKKMCANQINCYKDINPSGKGHFFELVHLSSATILYIDPQEEFSDECVIQLPKGVYRAMFIITFKNADCNCAVSHFFVK